jgi:hypothetical protein
MEPYCPLLQLLLALRDLPWYILFGNIRFAKQVFKSRKWGYKCTTQNYTRNKRNKWWFFTYLCQCSSHVPGKVPCVTKHKHSQRRRTIYQRTLWTVVAANPFQIKSFHCSTYCVCLCLRESKARWTRGTISELFAKVLSTPTFPAPKIDDLAEKTPATLLR